MGTQKNHEVASDHLKTAATAVGHSGQIKVNVCKQLSIAEVFEQEQGGAWEVYAQATKK